MLMAEIKAAYTVDEQIVSAEILCPKCGQYLADELIERNAIGDVVRVWYLVTGSALSMPNIAGRCECGAEFYRYGRDRKLSLNMARHRGG